jgi:SAM-dependent methyltransferase
MRPNYFDERVATTYDATSADMFAPEVLEPTVDFLADLATSDSVLELGIGTGRVALPLSQRGIHVHGIELSAAMVEQLRAKPGSELIRVTIGDFATAQVGDTFGLAYLVYNTITNLTSQDEQVECFRNVAAHLDPGGCFVVEVFVPILQRLPPSEVFRVFHHSPTRLSFDEYDVATQTLYSHHYRFEAATYQLSSVPFRYVWPSELDLMARLAGLRLRERWADWTRRPFTSASTSHVSVWDKPL